jgi:hypothetical protein
VVSFTPQPLYLRGKCPRYTLDRRLGVPQSQYGRHGEVKILDRTGTRTDPSVVQPVASRYTDYAIPNEEDVVIMRKTLLVVSPISVPVSPSHSELLLTNEAPKIDRSRCMWCEKNGTTKISIELNSVNTYSVSSVRGQS